MVYVQRRRFLIRLTIKYFYTVKMLDRGYSTWSYIWVKKATRVSCVGLHKITEKFKSTEFITILLCCIFFSTGPDFKWTFQCWSLSNSALYKDIVYIKNNASMANSEHDSLWDWYFLLSSSNIIKKKPNLVPMFNLHNLKHNFIGHYLIRPLYTN